MNKASRPQRLRIHNELGVSRTLAGDIGGDTGQFAPFASRGASPVLFLGLGPDPATAALLAQGADEIFYLEAPRFSEQMPASWREAIPEHWQGLNPQKTPLPALLQAIRPALQQGRVLLYRQAPRLFPSFWGPILGALRWQALSSPPTTTPGSQNSVLLPVRENGLLARELQHGFAARGMAVRLLHDDSTANGEDTDAPLLRELRHEPPALFLSVNFQGLDAHGERHYLLRAAGTRVAVWCVDNPWHLLSGLKAPFWREIDLFVTDASFIPQLMAAGAQHVRHLPLAAWPEGFARGDSPPLSFPHDMQDLQNALLFVGRSSFPHKQSFFAGLRPPPDAWREALEMLEAGQRPDFHWWRQRLGIETPWPGREVRLAGLGAEEAGMRLRLRCLQSAAGLRALHVVGDEAWQKLLPPKADLRFHPPVDYYGVLPLLYARARYSLNATSLLLPAGLTQRHFDVWTAGGFLLSDATPGLEIFPQELVRPMRVDGAWSRTSLEQRLEALEREPGLREHLITAWRAHLLAEHTYAHRAATILAACSLD